MKNWLTILTACSKKIRKEVIPFFRFAEANYGFGIGAGGDTIKRIDLVAEKALIDTLKAYNASCTLISEETGTKIIGPHPSDCYLTTDPLDGTTNAVRGLPFVATSLAVSKQPYLQTVETALVHDLIHNIVYTAQKGKGAHRNKQKIRPSTTASLEEAVIGVDFNTYKVGELAKRLTAILEKTRHIRHFGANALELCYVADGSTDAFIDLRGKLRTTDIAAAYLILHEAGGTIVTPEGKEMKTTLDPRQRVSFIATANNTIYSIIKGLLA